MKISILLMLVLVTISCDQSKIGRLQEEYETAVYQAVSSENFQIHKKTLIFFDKLEGLGRRRESFRIITNGRNRHTINSRGMTVIVEKGEIVLAEGNLPKDQTVSQVAIAAFESAISVLLE